MKDFVKFKTHPQPILEEIISNNKVIINSDYSISMRPLSFNGNITSYEMTFSFVEDCSIVKRHIYEEKCCLNCEHSQRMYDNLFSCELKVSSEDNGLNLDSFYCKKYKENTFI